MCTVGWASASVLAIVGLGGACHPTPSSSAPATSPAAATPTVQAPAEPTPAAVETPPESEPIEFTISVSSRCPEPWQASLVRRDKEQPRSGTGRFEATKDARTLRLRPGDSLVLTNENGGIMAIDFDDVTIDQVVAVEVAEDCSGVSKTVTRGGSRR